jgi:hypothetical protein
MAFDLQRAEPKELNILVPILASRFRADTLQLGLEDWPTGCGDVIRKI